MLPKELQQLLSIYIQKIQIETGIALLTMKGSQPEAALASIARARSAADDLKAHLLAEEAQIKIWEREENQWGDGSAGNRAMIECNLPESARYRAPWGDPVPVNAASRALALLAELAFILTVARALDQEREATSKEESKPCSLPGYSDVLALLYTRLHTEIYGHGESFPAK